MLLVVEDDIDVRMMLGYLLMKNGYALEEAADAEQARKIIMRQKPDLIVLDWMLPGMSGVDYARRLREDIATRDIPIIMLTAKGTESDKIHALDAGADDYITKPFSNREFLARIRVALRRNSADDASEKLQAEGLVIDLKSHRVIANNEEVSIDPTEFRLLHFFITHPDKVYNRTQLLDQIWGQSAAVEEQTINVYIRRLRKTLMPYGCDGFIQTVRNLGYRFSVK